MSATTYSTATGPQRTPTSWTKPLQLAVAGYYVVSGLWALSLPFWMGSAMGQVFNQAIQQQQQLNPDVSPPPAELTGLISGVMTGSMWASAVFAAAIATVAVIGAIRRWIWLYWVVLVLLGLSALALPLRFIGLTAGSAFVSPISVPAPALWANVAFGVAAAVVFLLMLIAMITRGPWGMTKPAPWQPPSS